MQFSHESKVEFVRLGDYVEVKGRIGWKGLKKEEYTTDGPFMISGNNLYNRKIDWDTCLHINQFRFEESPEIKLRSKDIIMTKDGTIGRVGYIEELPGPATINSTIVLIREVTGIFFPEFLYYYFQGPEFQNNIKEKISGLAVPHIFQRDIKKLRIPKLLKKEQQKIALILSKVDGLIQNTDQVIEQTQRLKKGLMQKLLTKGIRHTRFKSVKSVFGKYEEIPEEWQLVTIHKIIKNKDDVKTGPFGSSLRKEIFVSSGYKIYGQENVITDDFSVGYYYISEETFLKMKKYEIKPMDILISLVGTHGKVSLVPDKIEKGIINPRLLKITFDQSKVLPEFMKILLGSKFIDRQIQKFSHGLTMGILNTEIIKRLLFLIPPISEQQKIVLIISMTDEKIKKVKYTKERLSNLKEGLMQKLLTGRVRVKV